MGNADITKEIWLCGECCDREWYLTTAEDQGTQIGYFLALDDKAEKRATLAAAAPDLLTALRDLAWYADLCEPMLRETHPGKADALRRNVVAAKEAISKAIGA